MNGQWLAVQMDQSIPGNVWIATTDPLDPLSDPRIGKWKASGITVPEGPDFTMLGYDANGVYIGENTADADNKGRSPPIVFIPREKALAYPPQLSSDDIKIIGPLDKSQYGENLFPMIDQSGIGWPYATAIGVDNLTKAHLTYSLISPQFRDILSHGRIQVSAFRQASNITVKQPSGVDTISFSQSIGSAPTGDSNNIWVAHTIQSPLITGLPLAVRWYRLYIDNVTRLPWLAAWGEIHDPQGNYDYFNASILSLGKDDYTVVSLSRSGNSTTPDRSQQ